MRQVRSADTKPGTSFAPFDIAEFVQVIHAQKQAYWSGKAADRQALQTDCRKTRRIAADLHLWLNQLAAGPGCCMFQSVTCRHGMQPHMTGSIQAQDQVNKKQQMWSVCQDTTVEDTAVLP